MSSYKWKPGSRVRVDPDAAAEEFNRLREEGGGLTPAAVVEASRPKDAPLHGAFEWNNSKAAESYRQQQAASLIRALVVVRDDEEMPEHRAYVRVTREGKGTHYVDTETAAKHIDLFADALGRLEAKVREAKESARELEVLARQGSGDEDRVMRIAMAVKALDTAVAAINGLH